MVKNKINAITVVIGISVIIAACSAIKIVKPITLNDLENPPGTAKVTDNFYVDTGFIRNQDYLEFLHWTKLVYGESSIEYQAIFPDTMIWNNLSGRKLVGGTTYLNHFSYRNYPALGVSNKQAMIYSQWRSERVMEYLLISYGITTYRPHPVKDSVFTIEKYFQGKYYNTVPNLYVRLYPNYTLLDSTIETRWGFLNRCEYKSWK